MANPALTASELAWILQNAKPQAIVTTLDGWKTLRRAIEELSDNVVRQTLLRDDRIFTVDPTSDPYGTASHTPGPPPPGARDWKALLSSPPLKSPIPFTPSECLARTAVIIWSSGTSGKSKGVQLSHAALTTSLAALWHISTGFDGDERWLAFVPFFHVFGLTNVLLLAACCGGTALVMPKFEPRTLLGYVQRHRVTFLHMAPPVAVLLAKSPMLDDFDVSSVRGGVSGGAPLGSEVIETVHKRLGFPVKLGYGMSEAPSLCHQVGDTWEELQPQLGSTGVPLYGVEIKIVPSDSDGAGAVLKRGREGEILVRSPSVMSGYLNNGAATAEAFTQDGWLRTGDVGKIDDSGFLWITDRLKEVIKVKGFQVSPSELEAVLCASPLVADAGVISVFDAAQATELPRAYVVPTDTTLLTQHVLGETEASPELKRLGGEVRKWVEGRTAHYKWLRGNVVFVLQIPKTPSGKILRRLLKDTKGVDVCIYPEKVQPVRAKL
ncbi:hypothetical protein W97_06761 [Coniosporium apollinis CBS 100218]|uniref:AMP-dependent synthetase/ligase domain-containing protein n=1 Tax=Coniosporium apollinis (strain CBS 100218) TaxID=1168221 RepID=R7Z0M8_CONA1|nr:uncharacterized protein W97_06761 [Coniosporium apollinis CBS 100218]EON67618.1 hypothetical protein W97_06761 [Coniosporium apollinis CBS 100218]